jgi:transcriptional regulator with XRE-family HTH domain
LCFLKKKDYFTFFVKDEYQAVLEKLIFIRKQQGVSQFQAAERLGIGDNAYSKLEKGRTKLDMQRLIFILKILKKSRKSYRL